MEVLVETFNSVAIYLESLQDYLTMNDSFLPPVPRSHYNKIS